MRGAEGRARRERRPHAPRRGISALERRGLQSAEVAFTLAGAGSSPSGRRGDRPDAAPSTRRNLAVSGSSSGSRSASGPHRRHRPAPRLAGGDAGRQPRRGNVARRGIEADRGVALGIERRLQRRGECRLFVAGVVLRPAAAEDGFGDREPVRLLRPPPVVGGGRPPELGERDGEPPDGTLDRRDRRRPRLRAAA